jgi:lactate dehydrogenase-like 2-hydroxyacid dehydrogenase
MTERSTCPLTRRLLLFAIVVAACAAGRSNADTIAIIGTGNVGNALGVRFAELGHRVVYGSRDQYLRYNAVGGPVNFHLRPDPTRSAR